MSIVKDLLFILPIIVLGLHILYLNVSIRNEKTFLVNALKHDMKVPMLAQIRAINLPNNPEIVCNLKESCKETLSLMNMLIHTLENNSQNKKEIFYLEDIIISTFKKAEYAADSKNINFCYLTDNISFFANKELTESIFVNLVKILISECIKKGNITCKADNLLFKTQITFSCITNKHAKIYNKDNYALDSVGNNIRYKFCKNFIKLNGWKFKENSDNNIKSFTIIIPKKYNLLGAISAILALFHRNNLQIGKSVL